MQVVRLALAGVLFSVTVCAQFTEAESAAPAGLTDALRTRATEFFQFHTGPVNRRSIDYVAEDTKDYYYQSAKNLLLSFTLKDLHYAKDFQSAELQVETKQMMQVGDRRTEVVSTAPTNWRIEDGKWVWYYTIRQSISPFASSVDMAAAEKQSTGNTAPPGLPDFSKILAQGAAVMGRLDVESSAVQITAGQRFDGEVKIRNGYGGPVTVQLTGDPRLPGLSIVLDKRELNTGEIAAIHFAYAPVQGEAFAFGDYDLRLVVAPMGQSFPVKLSLLRAK
jgi:hypothetical protein